MISFSCLLLFRYFLKFININISLTLFFSFYEEPHIVRIRSRHHVRGLNNNRNRRSQFINSNGASSTSARDAIDPIAQLLSQLSDVRRVNNGASSSGQNGMMQFQFERQSPSSRLPIERIIRRHQQTSQLSSSIGSSHSESASNQQMPYMVLLDPTTSPSVSANSLSKSNSTGGGQISKISAKYLLAK